MPCAATAPDTVTVAPSPASRRTMTCGSGVCSSRLRVIISRKLLGRVARRADAARIGDEDEARAVDLHAFDRGGVAAFTGQKTVADVFVDGQRQQVTGADDLGVGGARVHQ
jgi:hypothetical protein